MTRVIDDTHLEEDGAEAGPVPGTARGRVRSIAYAVFAVLLVWLVVTHSLVDYLAEVSPAAALALRSSNAAALVRMADDRLNFQPPEGDSKGAAAATPGESSGRIPSFARFPTKSAGAGVDGTEESDPDTAAKTTDPGDLLPLQGLSPEMAAQIRSWARLALQEDPFNARAMRILGQLADAASDEKGASKLMHAAISHSLRESVAVFWLMRQGFETRDFAAAMRYADILLRTRPQVVRQLMPTLVQMSDDKEASIVVKNALAANPPWRALFFSTMLRSITDARTPLDLLLSLKDTSTPPTIADLRGYVNLLIQNGHYELAYYVWLQFLPRQQLARVGLLHNGSFESEPSGLAFDWVVTPSSGVTIDFALRPERDGRALQIEMGQGRVEFRGIAQVVMLPPGTYQLTGQYRGQLVGRRGLEWRVQCVGAAAPIGRSAMVTGATPDWTDFATTFTVPDSNCRAQIVRLWLDARSASERIVTGTLWYDKMQIARTELSEPPRAKN